MKRAALLACALASITILYLSAVLSSRADDASSHIDTGEGKRIYLKANCAGCHKWHGAGGGGYGGLALSLRDTALDRDQIIMTVTCGRPGTNMPYHERDAYAKDDKHCYDMTKKDLEGLMLIAASKFLQPDEIAAVTDYVLTTIKGAGQITLEQCLGFFGDTGSHVCDLYRRPGAPQEQLAQPKQDQIAQPKQ